MDFIAKKKAVFWSIVLLVLLNICALGTVWYQNLVVSRSGPPPPRGGRGTDVARFLERELGLNARQIEEVKSLQGQFFSRAGSLQHEIDRLRKEDLEELLASAPDTKKAEELAREIGDKETEKERLLFTHFMAIKGVCDADQKKKFDSLIHELLGLYGPPDRHGPPGRMAPWAPAPRDRGAAREEGAHFGRVDADGDGLVSPEEWEEHHRDIFRREIDTDRDGFATATELRRHHEERQMRQGRE